VRNCAGLATLGGAGEAVDPGSRVSCFGHLGDGNIHFTDIRQMTALWQLRLRPQQDFDKTEMSFRPRRGL